MKASALLLAVSLIALVAAANFAQEPGEPPGREPTTLEFALQPDRPGNSSPIRESERGNGFTPRQMQELRQMFFPATPEPRRENRGPGPEGPPRGPDGPGPGPGPGPGAHHEGEVHYHYHYYHRGQHEEHHTEHHHNHRSVHYHYHYHYN